VPDVGGRTGPNVIPKSTPVGRSYVGKYKFVRDGIDKNAVTGFRSFTTGQPRLCYLRSTLPRAPLPVVSRRSTLADVPELDHKLYAQRVKVNGEDYLPLNTKTVHILQPYLNGAKPVADMSLFERLVVSREYKIRHLNDLLISLASIGKHCKVLVILGEDRIWDLGGIHIRWEPVLKWCTQLQELEVKGE
jgi:hypothetical protein